MRQRGVRGTLYGLRLLVLMMLRKAIGATASIYFL